MSSLTKVAKVHTDKELRNKLRYHMNRMEIPAEVKEVRIMRRGGKIMMRLDLSLIHI